MGFRGATILVQAGVAVEHWTDYALKTRATVYVWTFGGGGHAFGGGDDGCLCVISVNNHLLHITCQHHLLVPAKLSLGGLRRVKVGGSGGSLQRSQRSRDTRGNAVCMGT